jgi:hypothetical protein
MSDINKMIKNVAFDIIGVTMIFGMTNYLNTSNETYTFFFDSRFVKMKFNYHPNYTKFIGIGTGFVILMKYY